MSSPALELELYNAIRQFIINDSPAFWEATVKPIIQRMVTQGMVRTGTVAIANTGLTVAEGVLMTEAEVIAAEAAGSTALSSILKRLGIRAAGGLRGGHPLVIAGIIGVSIYSTTREVRAAERILDPDNMQAYKMYINRWLMYMVKQLERGKTLREFPAPMLYQEWLNRDGSGEWWQR